jgi:hypothetical protein
LDGDTASRIKYRGSPAIGSKVLSLSGGVLPGHSGAPILDTEGLVVGIGNGGLKSGTIGIGWGIPITEINLQPVRDRFTAIEDLKKKNVDVLFDFETDELLRFETKPSSVRIGEDVTLHFENPIEDEFTVLLDGRKLLKRTLPHRKEIIVTVPGDQASGEYHIEIKRWEDNITKSDNALIVENPYDKFEFSVTPEKTKPGTIVTIKMNDPIGKIFNIYLQKNSSSYQTQLYKEEVSKDGLSLGLKLPENLVEGMYTIEMTSQKNKYQFRSNSFYVENPYRKKARAPEESQNPPSPGKLWIE